MAIHLQEEIDQLKRAIMLQSTLVEESVQKAVQAVGNGDTELAAAVIENDATINQREVELEEDCLKVLALHQPVATDLRFIVSLIKINSDLERIGDVAANIARRTIAFAAIAHGEAPFDFSLMASLVLEMLGKSLRSLVYLDAPMARTVIAADDKIDAMHRQTYVLVKGNIGDSSKCMDEMLLWLALSRHLERVADLAAHIAEDIVYMIDGTIVRHGSAG